jgi:aspartyl-tRNA(Asn)/glutamyl-tRNA(Gln) amidotransferase subunit B
LAEDRATVDYFEALLALQVPAKPAANWMLGPIKSALNELQLPMEAFPVLPTQLAGLIHLVQDNLVNFSAAAARILPELMKSNTQNAQQVATALNLLQEQDQSAIEAWVDQVIAQMPEKVAEYKKGKKGLIGLFMGEVKKISKGKADPQVATALLTKKLNA